MADIKLALPGDEPEMKEEPAGPELAEDSDGAMVLAAIESKDATALAEAIRNIAGK